VESVKRSARAIVIDDEARLVLVRRTKPGTAPYWTALGGGVEPEDPSVEAALVRELREELGASQQASQATIPRLGRLRVNSRFGNKLHE
jgi:8-oxo-dGTP pyrophosphatase MutT (NUDIX family)